MFSSNRTFCGPGLFCSCLWFLPFWIVAYMPDVADFRLILSWENLCTLYLRLKLLIKNVIRHLREKYIYFFFSEVKLSWITSIIEYCKYTSSIEYCLFRYRILFIYCIEYYSRINSNNRYQIKFLPYSSIILLIQNTSEEM